jgi:hypothetical protein
MMRNRDRINNNNSTTLTSFISEYVEQLAPISSPISPTIHGPLILSLPDHSSSLPPPAASFQVSNFQSLEISNICRPCTAESMCHSPHNFLMESECNQDIFTMMVEPDPPDTLRPTEDNIMKVLVAISNQMMANTHDLQNQILHNHQDLQNQLMQTELKFSSEIQGLTQDHEAFKQQSRNALLSLQSSHLSVGVPQVTHPSLSISSTVGVFLLLVQMGWALPHQSWCHLRLP